jgi:hypothetical protein
VQVRYGEGLAIHTDPESCAGTREGTGEALTGARIGGVSSGVSYVIRGADVVVACRRQQGEGRHRKVLTHPASSLDPQHVRTSSVREPGDLRPALGSRAQGRVGKAGGRSR